LNQKDRKHYLKEITFDELGIERLSDLYIHFKGDESFYKNWNELYKSKFENYLQKKKKVYTEKPGEIKSEVDKILEEFLPYRQNEKQESFSEGGNSNYTMLYIVFQELVREMSERDPDKGFLLMRVFKKMMMENEKDWLVSMKEISNAFSKVKNERDIMLTKYISELDIKEIIDNNHDNITNLISHKQLINQLVGHLNQMKELFAQSERAQ
jgi:hypothetical protein